jgi:hypothetical protein
MLYVITFPLMLYVIIFPLMLYVIIFPLMLHAFYTPHSFITHSSNRTEISVNYPTKHNLQIKYDGHLLYTTTYFGCLDQPSSGNVG